MNTQFKHESLEDRNSVLKYLNAIKNGIEQGRLTLGSDDQLLIFEPKKRMRFEVSVKRHHARVTMNVDISWQEDDPSQREELIIDSQTP